MTYIRDTRVDAYINALPVWQQRFCARLRDLIHATDPEMEETIKRTVQPYFVLQGNVCALLATKDHVNLFLYDRVAVPDPEGIITGGHDNKAARFISFYEGDTINVPALTTMLCKPGHLSTIGRTSTVPPSRAVGIRAASSRARSMSSVSSR
jgi:hypothetical protein